MNGCRCRRDGLDVSMDEQLKFGSAVPRIFCTRSTRIGGNSNSILTCTVKETILSLTSRIDDVEGEVDVELSPLMNERTVYHKEETRGGKRRRRDGL